MNETWTDERIARLKVLWAAGATGGKIAAELGVTRNGVIGKVHRLGLDGRPSPIGPKAGGDPVKKEARRVREAARKRRRVLVAKLVPLAKRVPVAKPKPTPAPALPPIVFAACQFIAFEPTGDDECKCRKPSKVGPYCAEHWALTHRPTPVPSDGKPAAVQEGAAA